MQFFTRFLALAATAAPFLAQAAPLSTRDEKIAGKYIIQLKPDTDIASIASHHNKVREIHARNLGRRDGGDANAGVEREYDFGGFKGYAGSFDESTIEELKAMPEVLVVEQDFMMRTTEENMTTKALVTQNNAPWGLASISSRKRGATDYIYDSSAGEGTFSYIVDTGIRTTHKDFEGRAVWGHNAVNDKDTDNQGHGTHVAGTIGSKTYGVAKKTTLVAVKIFEATEGTASVVISGFQWAVKDIVDKKRTNSAVINMSLGGPASRTWDAAIAAAWEQGVLAVVASGNANQDAANSSPCRSPETICVGNVQQNDVRAQGSTGSNYGPVVDIFAAGTGILSTYLTSDTATATLSGTSMASPHVAGLVSYLRGLEGMLSAAAIKARVLELATPDRVTDVKGSANLLAYNGNGR